jgi:type VI secretion system ImpM family protein
MGWQLPTREASLFGKLPTVLDYVRVNHSYPAAIALDEWLSRSLQDLTLASLSWPAARYRFLFAPSGSDHAVVGVFGPSRDRAGRKFPLSIFAPIPIHALVQKFAALPLGCSELFEAADALLDQAATLSKEAAAEQLASLPLPSADVLEEAHETLQNQLDARGADEFVRVLYDGVEYQAEEAFARATGALGKVRAAAPERALTLDCPLASSDDVGAWLSLPEACLSWSNAVPSLFWTSGSDPGRMLISLGAPLPSVPVWLADRKRKSDRLVSLYTPNLGFVPAFAVPTPVLSAPASSVPAPAPTSAPARGSAPSSMPASAPYEPEAEAAGELSHGLETGASALSDADSSAPSDPDEEHASSASESDWAEPAAAPDSELPHVGGELPAAPAAIPVQVPTGPSLWRKLRALAVSV